MGLKEKRACQEFVTNVFPGLKSKVDAAAKMPVEIDVNWESLQEAGMDHLYAEAWPKIYFEPLINGLSSVAADEMGAKALQSGLKKVMIQNTSGHYNPEGITFAAGVLTIDHQPTTNMDNVRDRAAKVQSLLENGL